MQTHQYKVDLNWTGNKGLGTSGYNQYERSYDIGSVGKPLISGSSDPLFRGDATKYNPEEFLLMAVASCHMLWYLHLCADAGITVTGYSDNATAQMEINNEGSGRFTSVELHPRITIANAEKIDLAYQLHSDANKYCFIANSCNFTIDHKPEISYKKP